MGRKRKRAQRSAKPRLATSRSTQSQSINLTVSPEQLIKNGDIAKAIDTLRTQLINEPSDERKRLLGNCYFQIRDYKEAANTWLTLNAPTANDLANLGVAWLNEDEWERARSALQRSLDLEERAYPLYLQAVAIKGDREYYALYGEERTNVINLLQKAQALPDCPAEALLLLDDLLGRDHSSERTVILEEAARLYPDHAELRLRYARHLAYEANTYAEALTVTKPLLSRTPPSQRALDCALWSAFKLGSFEQALTYADQLRPSSFWPYGPTIEQVKGDIYLAWGKTDEALACYERETQCDDFEAAFLGFFRIAKVWLVRNEHAKALSAALEGTRLWLDYPNELGCGRVLTNCSVSVGEGDDHTNACLHYSCDMVKEVCDALLSAGQEISVDEKGVLAYLLYNSHEETEPTDDEHETISRMDDLLPIVEQGSRHPHMGEDLARYYANKKDMARAIQVHLDYCLWKLSALEHHRLKPPTNEENQQLPMGWTFSEYSAEFECAQELLDSLSAVGRERCHTIAWEALQTYAAETNVVLTIFVPFFHSFWSDLLITGDMHHAVVETTKLLLQTATDDEELWWLLAYHLHELELVDEAERAYRHYLSLAPNSASALHNLSLIVEEKGALQEALALSQKAAALSPDDELIVKNARRLSHIDAEHQQAQQKQEGAPLWSRLTDSQKWLLCLMKLYPSDHWLALLPRIKQDEHQLRQLEEDWEWLLAQGICIQSEAENSVQAVPLLEPYIHEVCFQYWLAVEIARVQVRKKKNLWLPAAAELGDEQLADLSTPQRDLMQQAFMRQIAQVPLSGLEQVYLRFYRRIWKGLLIKWEMFSQVSDSYEIFLTRLPAIMTRQEMWECAYYAGKLSDYTYQIRAEKWYKVYLEQREDHAAYHNLSGIYLRRKSYQDALQMIEQALRLAPENSNSLEQKERIQQAIQQEEEQRQQQELERQKQQQLREQQLKSVEATIVAHLGDVDYYKLKILRTLKATPYFSSKKAFAREVRMEDGPLAGHWKKLVAWGMIIEDGRQPTVHPLVATYLEQGWPVEYGSFTNTLAVPNNKTSAAPANGTSSASKTRNISAITRRDIFDKLCILKIEGRLDLIEFLELTWPNLDSMPSTNPGESLKSEIGRMLDSSDWEYKSLFYNRLQLGSCDDDLFTSLLAACLHPLVRPDKKEVAELLSFFNEALHPDGYVFKLVSLESGRPIYRAYRFGTNDEEYIVPRAIAIIEQLARNFHLVVRKLSQRHDNRPPLQIRDEYDVQDLFYALLTPFFEDIRPEEVAPSHAGGHGRIDFLIKAEQIVIEIKKTRPSLKVKELRDQLIVDKDIYRTHPHCRTFIAFIYDPDGYIDNAIGFERDLSNTPGDIRVKVIVAPR